MGAPYFGEDTVEENFIVTNLIVGASAVHAAALELVVQRAELAEVAQRTVLRSRRANFRRVGQRVAEGHLAAGATHRGH